MDSKFEYSENLLKEISRINDKLKDLETDLHEHQEIDDDSLIYKREGKLSVQIWRVREALLAVEVGARKLLIRYSDEKISTYRKVGTVKAERFWVADNDKIDYYRAKYGITQLDLSEISSFKPTAGTQVCYMGDDSYVIPTLEGNMIINNGDWILTGVDGEHWAVKDNIFNKTYEKVTDKNDD